MAEAARAEAFASQSDKSRQLAEGYVRQAIQVAKQVRDIRDDVARHASSLQIPLRWSGTRLELMGIDGNWIVGPDLKGADARGVLGFSVVDGHLIVTFDDGESANLGPVGGDVTGPDSATSGHLVVFNGGTGKRVVDGGKSIASFATAEQGGKADTAVQPSVLAGAIDAALTSFGAAVEGALSEKAPLSSPAFTGEPTAPTPPPEANDNRVATMAALKAAVDNVLNGAPGALDTLQELAASLGNDANYAATVTTALSERLRKDQSLNDLVNKAAAFNNIKQNATTTATGVVEIATAGELRSAAGNKALTSDLIQSGCALVTLADATNIAIDWNSFVVGDLAIAANRTIANPTNVQPGVTRCFFVFGTTSTERSLVWGSAYKGRLPEETVTSTKGLLICLIPRAADYIVVSYMVL